MERSFNFKTDYEVAEIFFDVFEVIILCLATTSDPTGLEMTEKTQTLQKRTI